MKVKNLLILALFASFVASAQVQVDGYLRQDGTYVQPYHRTAPDSSRTNNYSTQGNVNPWTGQTGTVDPYKAPANPYLQQPSPTLQSGVCGYTAAGRYVCR